MRFIIILIVLRGVFGGSMSNTRRSALKLRNRRSIGGSTVPDRSYAFVVSIRVADEPLCGGTIISPSVILTAAHCVHRHQDNSTTVMVRSDSLRQGGSVYRVVDKIVHGQYNQSRSEQSGIVPNDIALLKLETPIQDIDKSTEIVKLAKQNETVETEHDSTVGVVIGWGATFGLSYNIPLSIAYQIWATKQNLTEPLPDQLDTKFLESIGMSNELRRINVAIISEESCKSKTHYMNGLVKLDVSFENIICSRNIDKGTGNGDSGGPLIVDERQVGIVSGGMNCLADTCDTCYYTKVAGFRDWIDVQVKNMTASTEATQP